MKREGTRTFASFVVFLPEHSAKAKGVTSFLCVKKLRHGLMKVLAQGQTQSEYQGRPRLWSMLVPPSYKALDLWVAYLNLFIHHELLDHVEAHCICVD